jgi:SOS-response transcriptional repressor LexA
MNTWTDRIKERMKALGMTQEILARKLGITRGAITHYLAGRRVPPWAQFKKMALVLKSDPAWLQYGVISAKAVTKKEKIVPVSYPLPLLSWKEAAEPLDLSKITSYEKTEYVPHIFTDQPRWYALNIQGDSMTSPSGHSKSFHAGEIVIIDPDKAAVHGSYVVALLPKAKEATFKQYVVDGGTHYLKPLNPQYPMIQLDEAAHICGVMIKYLA